MDNNELKHRLRDIEVPAPGESARKQAIAAAAREFRAHHKETSGQAKGSAPAGRPNAMDNEPARRTMQTRQWIFRGATAATVLLATGSLVFLMRPAYQDSGRRPAPISERAAGQVVKNEPGQKQRGLELRDGLAGNIKPNAPDAGAGIQRKTLVAAETPSAGLSGKSRTDLQVIQPEPEYVGRDEFTDFETNPVKPVAEMPVSTFSIDVDTASYAFVRRQLNSGVLPQKNAVRVEEMINYFDYGYETPDSADAPFLPGVAVYPAPWNPEAKLLHIGIKGYELPKSAKPRANLVFLIDTSGSMQSPDRLPLLKQAFRMLVETLEPEDSVAIVTYAGSAGTALAPTKLSEKGKILAALDMLRSGGSTAGAAGIRQAYALAEAGFDPEGVNRVLLATDGDFNVGITNHQELEDFISRKRESGIFLSVLGFGQGNYHDNLMQKLAQNGNGNAAYIDSLNEARKVLVDEAGSTLFPIAKDVKIQVEFNPARVAEYRLIGYETRRLRREDFNNDRVDAGEIGSGHAVTALYEIKTPESASRLVDEPRYQRAQPTGPGAAASNEYAFVKIRYKLPQAETSRLITRPVTHADERVDFDAVDDDLRFATAVAAFGQILRGAPYTGEFTFDDVIEIARSAKGEDPFGYRAEFLNLVRLAGTARAM
ncbi:MAG TPA: VWA domain-containing protein [Gammaproteobacteria bacterium]|nr:VWA domain-containing protein [Gammaproteobacteria bacterium]